MCNKIHNYHFLQINFASGLDLPCVYHYADDTLYQQCARMCQYPDTDPTHSSVASQSPVCAFPTPCHTADWCQTPQYVHYYAPQAHNPHCARRRNCKINLSLVCCEKWIALMKILWKTLPSLLLFPLLSSPTTPRAGRESGGKLPLTILQLQGLSVRSEGWLGGAGGLIKSIRLPT